MTSRKKKGGGFNKACPSHADASVALCIVFQFTMFSTQYIQHVSFPSSKLQIIAVAMDVPQVWVVHSWLRWDLLCNEATIEQFEQIIACEFQCLQLGLEERPSAMGLFTINAAAFSKSNICLKHMPPIYSVYYYVRTYLRTYVSMDGRVHACMHGMYVPTYVCT